MSIERNGPCPCGSGKKYKNCCIDKVVALPVKPISRVGTPAVRQVIPANIDLEGCDKIVGRLVEWVHAAANRATMEAALTALPETITEDQEAFLTVGAILNSWLAFHYQTDDGFNFAEQFLNQAPEPTADERAILSALVAEPIRLVEIQEIRVGESITVRDYFTDEKIIVRLIDEIPGMRKWDLLLAHFLVFADRIELNALAPVNRLSRDIVLDTIEDFLMESRKPDDDYFEVMRDFLPEVLNAVVEGYREETDELGEEGLELSVHKASYRILDERAMRRAMAKCPDFEADEDLEDSFLWVEAENPKGFNRGDAPTLGQLYFDGDTLIFITSSEEDLKHGKTLLEKAVGKTIRHLEDSIEEVEPLPEDEFSAAGQEMPDILAFLKVFADSPMEELDGMTPRAAALDPDLRPALSEFLKDMEYVSGHEEGVTDAITRVRRELKLED